MRLTHPIFQSKPWRLIVSLAKEEKKELYLVGGFLRDLLLKHEKPTLDLDFSLKKDAIGFGRLVALIEHTKGVGIF